MEAMYPSPQSMKASLVPVTAIEYLIVPNAESNAVGLRMQHSASRCFHFAERENFAKHVPMREPFTLCVWEVRLMDEAEAPPIMLCV